MKDKNLTGFIADCVKLSTARRTNKFVKILQKLLIFGIKCGKIL